MTLEEIFTELNAHMIKGLMVHNQMVCYYEFLNLPGYAKCHEYHYWCENKNFLMLIHHYAKVHSKLIKEKKVDDPELIPKSWYQYEKSDVDLSTKRNAVKSGLEKWLKWEKDTLDLYKKMYIELSEIGEVNDACFVECLIKDVEEEICEINQYYINQKMMDFDMSYILCDQDKKEHKYKKKIHNYCCCC